MKTKIFSLILSAAALTGLSACSDDWVPETAGQGQLRTATLGVDVDGAENIVTENSGARKSGSAVNAKIASRTLSRASINLDNFIVTVEQTNGTEINRWTYSQMPSLPTFEAGSYVVKVRSHEVEPAAWNAPYYEGQQPFTIVANQVTDVETVVCRLSNIRVSVKFTDELLKAADNADAVEVKITSVEGNHSLTFTPSETRSGYFEALADLATLRLDFSASINGSVEKFTKTIDNVAKGQHRNITIGLSSNPNLPPEEIGTITNDGQGITVDTEVIEDAPIETDYPWAEDNLDGSGRPGDEDFEQGGGEEPNPPTPPDWEISFTSATLNVDGKANNVDEYGEGVKDAIVNILSSKGFSHINVEIVSDMLTEDFLSGVGLTTKFDLAEPGEYAAGLAGLGFPTPDQILAEGVTSVDFNITMFVPLILESGDHKFLISVTDKEGNTKSMTLLLRKA